MNGYTYATNIKTVIINSMDQFQSDDTGSNIGVGFSGWDAAFAYSRENNLDYFGSVFLVMGDEEIPKALGYGMWRWVYYVRMHTKFDAASPVTTDQKVMELSSDFMDTFLDSTNIFSVAETGNVKVVSANYLANPEDINEITYLTTEYLIAVKEQISRS